METKKEDVIGQLVIALDADSEPVSGKIVGVNEEEETLIIRPLSTADVTVKADTIIHMVEAPIHPKVKARLEAEKPPTKKELDAQAKQDAKDEKQAAKDLKDSEK